MIYKFYNSIQFNNNMNELYNLSASHVTNFEFKEIDLTQIKVYR